MAVALRYLDKGYVDEDNPVRMHVHAENWLNVVVDLPNKIFQLPEGSKRATA